MQYYLQENMEQGRPDDIQQLQDQQQPPLRRAKPPETQVAAQNQNNHHYQHHQPPPPQKCPRCDSSNTKFCYYNNYSLSQPRYFCKACRRYWTQGGTLRNVPVGGGCRKSKRPKASVPSSSADEIARAQSSSALQSQNLTGGLIPGGGQGFRALPPMMAPPSMGNTLYTGGSFMSSLAAMHSLQPGINQRATAVNLGGGSGNIQYDANNMAAVLRAQAPPQYFHAQNDQFFPSTMAIPTRPPLGSWTQSFINRGAASSSAGNPTFWDGATAAAAENVNQASTSFNPNHWPDNNPGFDPPQ